VELHVQVAGHPLREHMVALLMLALYRSGRTAEALLAYDKIASQLAQEFGAQPGPELQIRRQHILQGHTELLYVPLALPESDAEVIASGADPHRPALARVVNWAQGGDLNQAADRAAGEIVITVAPGVAQLNNAAVEAAGRGVRYMAQQGGVTQFIDPGAHLTTKDGLHATARRYFPAARFAYTHEDPTIVALGRKHLGDAATYFQASFRDPRSILEAPQLAEAGFELDRPLGFMMREDVNFMDDDEVEFSIRWVVDRLAAGSHVMMVFATSAGMTDLVRHQLMACFGSMPGQHPIVLRTIERIEQFAALPRLKLVTPVVDLAEWMAERPSRRGPFRSLLVMAVVT
jgi:hypothetical protein